MFLQSSAGFMPPSALSGLLKFNMPSLSVFLGMSPQNASIDSRFWNSDGANGTGSVFCCVTLIKQSVGGGWLEYC